MLVPTPKPTMFCRMSANIANLVFVFWCWRYDRWLQLLKNIFKICRQGDMQKAFLVGRSKYLPASPLVDLIVSCKSREFADSHYNLINCFSSNTFGRCIRVFLHEAYFVIHSTKLRLYVVKNLCRLDTALEALWSRLKSGQGSYESHSSHSLRNINENYVLWNFWKFLKALFFMLFIHSGSKYVQNPVCSFPYHLFVSWKIWLLSGSYGAIVYWFLHFMFLVWHSFLWKRI
jgi:hypothetical protein